VRVVDEVTLDVSMPRAPSDAQAQREIAIYIKAWQAMNPSGYAHVVGEGTPSRAELRRRLPA
jgi:hypothetical protein